MSYGKIDPKIAAAKMRDTAVVERIERQLIAIATAVNELYRDLEILRGRVTMLETTEDN